MADDIDPLGQVHALLDPLRDGGVLTAEECDELCRIVEEFLKVIRAPQITDPEQYWQHFQRQFGFARINPLVTPMNAANLCPEPQALLEAANLLRLLYNRNVAQQTRTARGERVLQLEKARELLARGLGLNDPKEWNNLAIVRNASEGNNAISCGYRQWDSSGPRENVVLWSENHPTNLEAWRLRAEWGRKEPLFDVRVVKFDQRAEEQTITAAFTDKIDPQTRFVSFSETANSTGFRIPESVIRAIWNNVETRRLNCHVHIDGTMAWGARPTDQSLPFCHSFVSSAHKWFLGPKETGIFYMSPDKVADFVPGIFAYDYRIVIGPWREMPENALRFELLGQRDDVNIITLAWTQLMWNELARRKPYQRVSELAQYLMEKLKASRRPWIPVTPGDPRRSWGVVRVRAPRDGRSQSLYDYLYAAPHRIAGSGGLMDNEETFRLCPHIYNTKADIDRAVAGMNAWYDRR